MTEEDIRVCSRCGTEAGEAAYCSICGLHLLAEPELPTRAEWVAAHPDGPASESVPGGEDSQRAAPTADAQRAPQISSTPSLGVAEHWRKLTKTQKQLAGAAAGVVIVIVAVVLAAGGGGGNASAPFDPYNATDQVQQWTLGASNLSGDSWARADCSFNQSLGYGHFEYNCETYINKPGDPLANVYFQQVTVNWDSKTSDGTLESSCTDPLYEGQSGLSNAQPC